MGPDMNIIFEMTLAQRNIILEADQDNLKKYVEAFAWVKSENAFISWEWQIGLTTTSIEDKAILEEAMRTTSSAHCLAW